MHIDHVTIHVADYSAGKGFYTPLFEAIGGKIIMDLPEYQACGY